MPLATEGTQERQHLVLPQLRKVRASTSTMLSLCIVECERTRHRQEHLSPSAQDTSQHTNLSALLRRHKVRLSEYKAKSHLSFVERRRTRRSQVPPHIRRRSQRLLLLQSMNPPVRQRPIRKRHIRKPHTFFPSYRP